MKTFALATIVVVAALCNRSAWARSSFGVTQLPPPTKPSNILAFLPTEAKSHFIGFKPLLETLVSRGHNVTLVSPFSLDGAEKPYRYVEVERTVADVNMFKVAKYMKIIPTPIHMWWFGPYISETSLNKSSVANFIRDDRSSFDVVLFENFFHECFAAIGHKYGASLVQLLPFSANPRVSQWQSNPYDPAYMPDMASTFTSNMTFAQRTTNSITAFFYTVLNRVFYLPRHRALVDKYFVYPGHERRPELTEILRNISLTLVNSHPVIGSPVPTVPSYVNVAGMHCVPPKELPQDLKWIMDESEKGVVYFSLGSVVKSSKMPKETVSLLLSELSKIEHTVLWKWETDEIPELPKNVIIRKWFPQNDILGHPNCKLFITHGGVHSTIESVYHGVPMLAVPVFGDQLGNSLRAQYRGVAIQVPYFDLTHEAFGNALHELLNDPAYGKNAKKISDLFNDNPLPPLQNAVYWIEHVSRHGGAQHLRTAANDLYWFQYLLLDVVMLMSCAILSLVWVVKKIIGWTVVRCCRGRRAPAEKKKKQ